MFLILLINYIDAYLHEDASSFGNSDMFIASLRGNNLQKQIINGGETTTEELLNEAHVLASCGFEEGTKWGFQASLVLQSELQHIQLHTLAHTHIYISIS